MKFLREVTGFLCFTGCIYLLWKYINTAHRPAPDDVNVSSDLVRVSVYYETLCPDSIKFITNQLWPTYRKLSTIMEIELIPYGKASYTRDGDQWSFKCQHGPPECKGNTVQACAINFYPQMKDSLAFIDCAEGSNDPSEAGQSCATEVGLSWTKISTCANGIEGNNLLHEMGVKTDALIPKLYFVPWILINGRTSDKILDEALTNLQRLVCKNYSGQPLPPACN